jgi:hypothetical protein
MSNFLDQFLVYHPASWIDRDWARATGLPLEDVWFETADGMRLFGWYVEARAASGVLLWCHGNAGNIIHRLENLVMLHRIGISVFIFDYRGYGRSAGTPSEEGLYADATAAYDYLVRTRGVPPARLVLFGRSLGAAVAADVASRNPAAGLILESPFPSVEAIARAFYFGLPAHWLVDARYDLLERLKKISVPILVVHGDRDSIIPVEMGKQVYEAARPPKALYIVPGADHNDLYLVGGQSYFRRLKQFIEDIVR